MLDGQLSRHAEQFGQVHRLAAAAIKLMDLGPAAESVGEYDCFRHPASRGKQHLLGAGDADLMVSGLEAEVPGQAAAAGLQGSGPHTPSPGVGVGVPAQDGVLMAVDLR